MLMLAHSLVASCFLVSRSVTKLIRMSGSMLGKMVVQGSKPSAELAMDDPNTRNLAAEADDLPGGLGGTTWHHVTVESRSGILGGFEECVLHTTSLRPN